MAKTFRQLAIKKQKSIYQFSHFSSSLPSSEQAQHGQNFQSLEATTTIKCMLGWRQLSMLL